MKYDFYQDKRLMQQAPPAGGSSDPYTAKLEQARNAYNRASAAVKANPNDASLQRAQIDAGAAYINTAIESGVLREGSEAWKQLVKVAPTLASNLATYRQDLGKKAGEANIDLIRALRDGSRQLLQTEASSVFNLGMLSPQQTVSMISMVKAIAEVLDLFGIETSSFVAKCDEKIQQSLNGAPKMDTSRVDNSSTDVSSAAAEADVSQSTARAQNEILNASAPQMAQIIGSLQTTATGGGATSAPTAQTTSVIPTSVSTSLSKHLISGDITPEQNRDLRAGYANVAQNQGNKNGVIDTPGEQMALGTTVDRLLHRAANAASAQKADQIKVALGLTPAGP